jgi:minor extracellular serine protease Vpr
MKKILATILIFSAIGLGVIAFGVGRSPRPDARPNANADAFTRGPDVDRSSAVVQLKGDPVSTSSRTKPAHGRKIDFNSNSVRSYRAQLNAGRNEFKRWLRANAPRAKVTGEYDISLNAVRCNSTARRWGQSQPHQWCKAPNTLHFTILL